MAEHSIPTSAQVNNRMARFAAWNKLSLDMIRRSIISALLIGLGLFILFAMLSYSPSDPGWTQVASDSRQVTNLMGASGAWFADVFFAFLGYAAWLLPLFFLYELVNLWWVQRNAPRSLRYPAVVFSMLALAASLSLFMPSILPSEKLPDMVAASSLQLGDAAGISAGGILGFEIGQSLSLIAGKWLALLFSIPLFLVAFSYGFQVQWRKLWRSRHNLFAPRVIDTSELTQPVYTTDRTMMPRRDEAVIGSAVVGSIADNIKSTLKPIQNTLNPTVTSAQPAASVAQPTQQSATPAHLNTSSDTAVPMPTQPITSRTLGQTEGVSLDGSLGNVQDPSYSDLSLSSVVNKRVDPVFGDLSDFLDIDNTESQSRSGQPIISESDTTRGSRASDVMSTLNKLSNNDLEQPIVFGGTQQQGMGSPASTASTNTLASRIAAKAKQARDGVSAASSDSASKTTITEAGRSRLFSGESSQSTRLGNPSNPNADIPLRATRRKLDEDQMDLLEDVPRLIPEPTFTSAAMAVTEGETPEDVSSEFNQVIKPADLHKGSVKQNVAADVSDLEAELDAMLSDEPENIGIGQQQPTQPDYFTDTKGSRAFAKAAHRASLPPLPPLELLEKPDPNQKPSYSKQELARLSELLEIKLNEFNIKASVVSAQPGPVVTRFEVDLAPGVKASKVTNISRDLARSLSMASVRVVEVIPGKPYIGIEVPNHQREMVRLYELLTTKDYQDPKAGLSMALGKDIAGRPVVTDLAKAPHMLVAGTTGSGKSVAVNAMLLSLLLKYTPEQLRLILIDPKQLELANYNDIPHLLTEVVTDMKDAASALNWCVMEMERRYKLMAFLKVRKLSDYNKKIAAAEKHGEDFLDPLWRPNDDVSTDKPPRLKQIPLVVVVADEFADMIMQVGKQAEELITRLAQKSRAAGIHLILATQRPSVDVITGLIKANIPTRVALRVNSKVDSRTILDSGGAEDMLGNGDMLFLGPGKIEPERAHGAFISDDEVNTICDAWRERGSPDYVEDMMSNFDIDGGGSSGGSDSNIKTGETDALYDDAVAFVMETRKVSASSIQRKFSIGYNRAARIVDAMESAGLVSSMGKSGKREILM